VEAKRIKKPKWYRQTERLLKAHKYLPIEIDNIRLQIRMNQLAGPTIVQPLREIVTQHMQTGSSPTEREYILQEGLAEKLERKQILLQMLDNVVKTFSPEEHLVYKLRYESEKREKEVYTKLQMSRSSYFELQRQTVMKAARLLGIPIPHEDQPPEWTGELFTKCAGHFPD
jgi:hypothetical protein